MDINRLPTKYKVLFLGGTLLAVVILFFKLIFIPAVSYGHEQSEKAAEIRSKTANGEYLKDMEAQRDLIEKDYGKILAQINDIYEKEKNNQTDITKLVDWVGLKAVEHNLDISCFSDISENNPGNNDVREITVDLGIKGNIPALHSFCFDLSNMGIKYSVGRISLKIDKDYEFLGRYYDAITNIPWYTNPIDPTTVDSANTSENIPPTEEPPAINNEPVLNPIPVQPSYPDKTEIPQKPSAEDNKPADDTNSKPSEDESKDYSESQSSSEPLPPSMNERIDELLKQVNFVKEHNITPSMKAVLLPCAFSMGKAIPLVDMREFTLGKYSLRMNIRFFCYTSNEEAEKRGIL